MWGVLQEGIKLYHDRARCCWEKTMFALFLMQLSPSGPGIYLTFAHICWPHTAQWTVERQMCHLFSFVVTHLLYMGSCQLLMSVVFKSPLHGAEMPFKPKPLLSADSFEIRCPFICKSLFSFSSQEKPVVVFFIHTFWCDKDSLPRCVCGRLRASSALLCLITLENGFAFSLSKDNKEGETFLKNPCFHKMPISWGVTDGTVILELLAAAQSSRRRVFGVRRSGAGWTADFSVAASLENTYPYFAEL